MSFALCADINLAVSNAQQGPAAELGRALNQGARLYFDSQSQESVHLHTKNDGYEPELALINTREFHQEGFQILFNYVGTPTTKAIFNFIKAKNLILVAPYTGADFLRQPENRNIFNLRASYEKEAKSQIHYLSKTLKLDNLAIVIQADAFGLALEKYFIQYMQHSGLKPSVIARFKRNTDEVSKAALAIKKAKPQAVIFVGTYTPMARLVETILPDAPETIFTSVSFISSQQLIHRVPANTKLLISEVVPNPNQCEFAECRELRELLPEQNISHGVFEGYLNAKWINNALSHCSNNDDKFGICVAAKLESMDIDLLGKNRKFDTKNRQLLQQVYFSKLNLP